MRKVRRDSFDGFEGLLLTDPARSTGAILANTKHGLRRARFTIAHELGHFPMEHHVLTDEHGFRCRLADLGEREMKSPERRQETEANTFAAELLAPPYLVRQFFGGDPGLDVLLRMTQGLDLSYEACVARYVELHPEPVAAVWSKSGTVRYALRSKTFPWVALKRGDRLPALSHAQRVVGGGNGGMTDLKEVDAFPWTGQDTLELYEQARVMSETHAVTLLWATLPDEKDEEPSFPDLPRFGWR